MIKIPTSIYGYDGKEEYEKIVNGKEETEIQKPIITPIIISNQDLQFVTDENLYKEIKKFISKEFPTLNNPLIFEDDIMKQSNPYLAIAVDMFLKTTNSGFRIARQSDLETNLQMFKGNYIDSGLALRNLDNKNKEQAIYLFNQLKTRGISKKDFPIWINLRGLTLDSKLNFHLTEESQYKTAECLNWENGTNYSKTDDFGLPQEKDKSSRRQIWTAEYSLSRVYLNRCSNLSSNNSDLLDSYDNGRVVLAKAKD